MDVSRDSLRRYSIVICMKVVCHARKVMHFAAQAQGFVKVARLRRSSIGSYSFRVKSVQQECPAGVSSKSV